MPVVTYLLIFVIAVLLLTILDLVVYLLVLPRLKDSWKFTGYYAGAGFSLLVYYFNEYYDRNP